jgi:uncharacterized protein with von Willebrand factor type A (vWA) domain
MPNTSAHCPFPPRTRHDKLLTRKSAARTAKERVAAILQRCTSSIVEDWLVRVENNKLLNDVSLTDEERTGYLPNLIEDLIVRLREPNNPGEGSDSIRSAAAVAHGKLRKLQGYLPGCSRTTHEYCR